MIGGVEPPIFFAGLAPGQIGLYEINVQVPTGVPSGDAIPLNIVLGSAVSNTVTVAVE